MNQRVTVSSLPFDQLEDAQGAAQSIDEEIKEEATLKPLRKYGVNVKESVVQQSVVKTHSCKIVNKRAYYSAVYVDAGKGVKYFVHSEVEPKDVSLMQRMVAKYAHENVRLVVQPSFSGAGVPIEELNVEEKTEDDEFYSNAASDDDGFYYYADSDDDDDEDDENKSEGDGSEKEETDNVTFDTYSFDYDDDAEEVPEEEESQNDYYLNQYIDDDENSCEGPYGSALMD